jgi:hypothetical protein
MARTPNRLTDLRVRREKAPGLYPDGDGLYLQVMASGAKSWVLWYMLRGRPREMGLGSQKLYGLAEARVRAQEARRLCNEGIDPIDHRKAQRTAKALTAAKAKTLFECFEAWMKAYGEG